MSTKIDSSVGPAAPPAPVRPVTRSCDAAGSGTRSAASSSSTAKSTDSLALTGDAHVMQDLEHRVKNDSGVDENKVAEMRRILAQGLYNADPSAIAGRLMQLEWSLGHSQ